MLARIGIGRPRSVGEGVDARTAAMLNALGRLTAAERRAVVLSHMAGVSLAEISAVEQVSMGSVQARLARARLVVTEGMADVLPEVLGGAVGDDASSGMVATRLSTPSDPRGTDPKVMARGMGTTGPAISRPTRTTPSTAAGSAGPAETTEGEQR